MSYGGVPVLAGDSLLLMDARWKAIDRPMKASVKVTRQGNTTVARYQSALTTLTKTVTNYPDCAEARWEFKVQTVEG